MRISEGFNDAVQVDLVFITHSSKEHIVLHMVDEATRWSMADEISDKETETLIACMGFMWFRIFGAPNLLISDTEGGIASDDFGTFLVRWGCSRKLRPKGGHATIVERHHEIL